MSSFLNFKRSKAVQKAATTPVAPAPERFPLADPMPFPASDKAERKVYLFVHQDMQLRFFDRNRIFIGKNRDDVFYSDTQLVGTIIMLSYDAPNTTWYVVSLDGAYNVWLNGIRLRPGNRYAIPCFNTIDVQGVTKFAVEYIPQTHRKPMDAAWIVGQQMERALSDYAKTGDQDLITLISTLLTTMPMYSWLGIHYNEDGTDSKVYIPPIPARRNSSVKYDCAYLNSIQYREDLELQLPLFTSEEEACKGGTNLGAFLYDYPLPIFNLIMQTGRDVVIDPFSDHPLVLSGSVLRTIWYHIQNLNYTDNCPGPNWVRRTIMPHG